MIDLLSLGLTHALMLVAAWRLVRRPDLDREIGEAPARPPIAPPAAAGGVRRDA